MTTPVTHALCEADLEARFGSPHPPQAANKVKPELTEWMAEFIRHSPFVVLATSTSNGACDVSPKGGGPGFVAVLDARTLLIPDYAGNNLFFGHRNILDNPQLGLLFMIPGEGWTLRVNGRAQLVDDDGSLATLALEGKAEKPRLGIKVAIEECFSHCTKAFARSDLWNPEKHRVLPNAKATHA